MEHFQSKRLKKGHSEQDKMKPLIDLSKPSFHALPNMLRRCVANECGVRSENESVSIRDFKENTKGK